MFSEKPLKENKSKNIKYFFVFVFFMFIGIRTLAVLKEFHDLNYFHIQSVYVLLTANLLSRSSATVNLIPLPLGREM